VNAVTGAPIANASVTARQGSISITVQSDKDGAYSFPGLVPGDVRIDATATGYQPFAITVSLAAGMNTFGIRLQPSQ